MAKALSDMLYAAFKKADPKCTHSFEWADFGPDIITSEGLAVVLALAEEMRSSEASFDRRSIENENGQGGQ